MISSTTLAQIKAVVDELAVGDTMPSYRDYDAIAREKNLPSRTVLVRSGYPWKYLATLWGYRVKVGPNLQIDWAAMKEDAIRLSNELHDGITGPNPIEWELYAKRNISRFAANNKFGSWRAFLAWCGLEMGTKALYMQATAKRKNGECEFDKDPGRVTDHEQAITMRMSWPLSGRPVVKTYFNWTKRQTVTQTVFELR
jgi:hypothetical protein